MELNKCMKEVLRAKREFHSNHAQLANLLQQLETLQTLALSYIQQHQTCDTNDQVELVECVKFLVDVVIEERGQFDLIQQAIGILLNLSYDEFVKKLLFETFCFCPSLVSLVEAYSGLTEEAQRLLKPLKLLQRITYGHRINYHQAYVEKLLKFLVLHVLDRTELLISPILGTLANMCRNNLLVHTAIRNAWQLQFKKLLKILRAYFDNQDPLLVIFSLSVFTSLCLHESDGQKVFFEGNNVERTLQIIFAVNRKCNIVAQKYAADLLSDLVQHPVMQIQIQKYQYLPESLQDVLSLLACSTEESTSEMLKLLLSLCTLPSVRQAISKRLFTPFAQNSISTKIMLDATRQSLTSDMEPLLCCLRWAAQDVNPRSHTPCLAIEFLIDLCQYCLCGSKRSYQVHLLTPVFTDLLSRPEQTKSTEKTIKLVQLLTVLCLDTRSQELLSSNLSREVLASIVKKQLSKCYITCASVTSTFTDEVDSEEEGSRCVLLLLDLVLKLGKNDLSQYLWSILKERKVMNTLALGLTSVNQEWVEMSLRLLCFSLGKEDVHPDDDLCDAIACLNKQKQSAKRVRVDSWSLVRPVQRLDIPENKENIHPFMSISPVIQLEQKGIDKSNKDAYVETLITKIEDIMGAKDDKTAEVIEVFKDHIKAFQNKEEHLNNLLEAKSLVITKADGVMAHLRGVHAIQMAEIKRKMKESKGNIDKMNTEMDQNKEKIKAQFEKQCGQLKDRIATCQQENKTLSDMNSALQEAHDTLKEQYSISCNQSKQLKKEKKKLSKQLKKKDTMLQDLSSSLQDLQRKDNEKEEEIMKLEKELKREIKTLSKQLEKKDGSVQKLTSSLQDLQNNYFEKLEDVMKLKKNRKTLSKQLNVKDTTVQELNLSLQDLQSKYSEIEEELANLKKERTEKDSTVQSGNTGTCEPGTKEEETTQDQ